MNDIDADAKDVYLVQVIVKRSWDKQRKLVLHVVIWKGFPNGEDWTGELYKQFVAEGA